MNEAIFRPTTPIDQRLVLAIVIAMAVHGMVVLGVRLPAEAPVKARFAAMEVVLMPAPAKSTNATSELNADVSITSTVASDEPPLLLAPALERPQVKAASVPQRAPAPRKLVAPKIASPTTPVASPAALTPLVPAPAEPLLPSGTQLIERSMAMAATGAGLIAEKTVSGQSLAERTHYIKNNTRDFAEITYKAEVRDRIKRFGGLFQHPVPAGTVTVAISIGLDGSLLDAHIVRSSHVAATDEEVMRIVKLAAPFSPIWPERARNSDVVHLEQPVTIEQDGGFSHGQ